MILLIIISILLIINLLVMKNLETFSNPDLKICILIINRPTLKGEGENEIYDIQRNTWKKYLQQGKNIDCFFIECGETTKQQGDYLLTECKESFIPGIYQKTILSFEYLLDSDYDFFIRTNLNSFFVFPYLIKVLKKLQHLKDKPLYTGDYSKYSDWICGNSIILNKKAISILTTYGKDPQYFYQQDQPDDVIIGKVLSNHGVKTYPLNDIVYWMVEKSNESQRHSDIKKIIEKQYPIIRTRPYYDDTYYYQCLMNALVNTFYYNYK